MQWECITANYIISFHFLSASKSLQIFVIISKSFSLVNLNFFKARKLYVHGSSESSFNTCLTLSFGSH